MKFRFNVTIEVERIEGKFATRDEIADYLRDELESAIPGEVDGVGADGDTRYDVTDSTVEDA